MATLAYRAMRNDLTGLNRNYVLSLVVCDNVWRTVHLLRCAGVDSY